LNRFLEFLNTPGSVKILVTRGEDGLPHPVVKASLRGEDGNIVYLEFLESSRTNRYMTQALWFDTPVGVLVLTADARSFTLCARPVRALVSGKDFQRYYEEARDVWGFDLATVWVLRPEGARETTLRVRAAEEAQQRPYFIHLDRLAKKDYTQE
jgi:hypothetical protein